MEPKLKELHKRAEELGIKNYHRFTRSILEKAVFVQEFITSTESCDEAAITEIVEFTGSGDIFRKEKRINIKDIAALDSLVEIVGKHLRKDIPLKEEVLNSGFSLGVKYRDKLLESDLRGIKKGSTVEFVMRGTKELTTGSADSLIWDSVYHMPLLMVDVNGKKYQKNLCDCKLKIKV